MATRQVRVGARAGTGAGGVGTGSGQGRGPERGLGEDLAQGPERWWSLPRGSAGRGRILSLVVAACALVEQRLGGD